MVIIKATANSEAGAPPTTELIAAMGAYNESLIQAGVMENGGGLHPSSNGARVRFKGDDRIVTKGPFALDGLVSGYWIWKVDSLDHAIEWLKKCPHPMPGEEAELEIRPIFSAEDFGEALTPELRAQEEDQRRRLSQQS